MKSFKVFSFFLVLAMIAVSQAAPQQPLRSPLHTSPGRRKPHRLLLLPPRKNIKI